MRPARLWGSWRRFGSGVGGRGGRCSFGVSKNEELFAWFQQAQLAASHLFDGAWISGECLSVATEASVLRMQRVDDQLLAGVRLVGAKQRD